MAEAKKPKGTLTIYDVASRAGVSIASVSRVLNGHGSRPATRDRVLEAARYIPVGQLGTTDDCGFAPFCDDVSTTRATAFAKIRARVEGTALAEQALGVR